MKLLLFVRSGIIAGLIMTLTQMPLAQAEEMTAGQESEGTCETQLVLVADASGAPSEPPGDVKERAVPRLAPGMVPGAVAGSQIEGGIFEGKRLKAKPGYHFEPQAGSTAMLRPNSGGAGVKLSCRCMKGKGACIMTIETSGTSAYCSSNGCAGDCEMRLTTGLLSPGLRIQ